MTDQGRQDVSQGRADEGPRPWGTWRNIKGSSLYTVVGVSVCSTNGPREGVERVVVYISHTYQKLRHRDLAEFLEKFVPVAPPTDTLGSGTPRP